MFYQSLVASAVFIVAICWGGGIRAGDAKKLRLIKKAGLALGCCMDGFKVVVEKRTLNKVTAILDKKQHPLHELLVKQQTPLSRRLIQLCCRKESEHFLT